MTEDEVLDEVYCGLDLPTAAIDLYGSREDLPRPELYIKFANGECWRIKAERHPHGD